MLEILEKFDGRLINIQNFILDKNQCFVSQGNSNLKRASL